MKNKLKIASILVSLAMLSGVLAGCGDSGSTSSGAAGGETSQAGGVSEKAEAPAAGGEPVKLLIMTGADQPEQPDGPAVWAEITARLQADGLNISPEVRSYAWGDYKEQVNRMAAAGEHFDIYLNFQGDLPGDVARKQCIELGDLIAQYGPNLTKMLPEDLFKDVSINGKIYGIPANYPFVGDGACMIRKDLREKYNLPEVKTLEDFELYLDAITKNENMSGLVGRGVVIGANLGRAFGEPTFGVGSDMATFATIDPTVKPYKVESAFETEATRKKIAWNRKAYTNGWIPKDILTISDPNTLMVSGKAGAYDLDMWTINTLGPTLRQNIEGAEFESFSMMDFSQEQVRLGKDNNFASISSTSEHPAESIQFLDWIRADKANYDLIMLGKEGAHWEAVGEDSYRLPEGVDPAQRSYNPSPWWFRTMQYDRVMENSEPGFLSIYNQCINVKYTTPDILNFTFDSEPVKTEWAQISTAYAEVWRPIEQGIEASDEAYQSAIDQFNQMGLQTILDEVQKQLDAWAAANDVY